MPSTARQTAIEEIRLIGEVVRPWDAPEDLSQDQWVLYAGVRPEGEAVGFIYVVQEGSPEEQKVVAYFNGQHFCTCQHRNFTGQIRCSHVGLVRARTAVIRQAVGA